MVRPPLALASLMEMGIHWTYWIGGCNEFRKAFLSHSLSVAQNMLNIQVVKRVRWCCQRIVDYVLYAPSLT